MPALLTPSRAQREGSRRELPALSVLPPRSGPGGFRVAGEDHPQAVLTARAVARMRRRFVAFFERRRQEADREAARAIAERRHPRITLLSHTYIYAELGAREGVARNTAYAAIHGDTWALLDEPPPVPKLTPEDGGRARRGDGKRPRPRRRPGAMLGV